MTFQTQTLARTTDYAVISHYQPKEAGLLLITFGDVRSGLTDKGFGTDWALKRGYDTVYVAQRARSQYQGLAREEFTEIVSPILGRYDRVVCYGSSVGGYCAFYYGGAIDSEIVAAAPRLPCHPIINAPRFRYVDYRHPHDLPQPVADSTPVVILDPLNLTDSRFTFQWAGPRYPRMHLIAVPGGGHAVLKSLAAAGVTSTVMASIIEGRATTMPKWARARVSAALSVAVDSAASVDAGVSPPEGMPSRPSSPSPDASLRY